MGLSASQGRMLLLTARKSDLEFRAQQISQRRLVLSQQLEDISMAYEEATSNRRMKIGLYELNSQDSSKIQSTENLTYKYLVSGCFTPGMNSMTMGIQASEFAGTDENLYSSTSAYRLVDCEGNIVITNQDEIPETINKTVTSDTKSTIYPIKIEKGGTTTEYQTIHMTTDVTKDKNGKDTVNDTFYHFVLPKAATGDQGDNIAKHIGDNIEDYKVEFDSATGNIKVTKLKPKTDEEKTPIYFDLEGNRQADQNQNFKATGTLNIIKNGGQVPQGTLTEIKAVNAKLDPKYSENSSGPYSLKDEETNEILHTYVIDKTLGVEKGSIGPNYLQDCLRNGKYLIQKFNSNTNEESRKWTNVSWESAVNIQDEYYVDDDDKAKAKYDRLQNQIQAQDKKLELELDNIETQRSAVTTEEESVKKVIDENIEGSFNAFA